MENNIILTHVNNPDFPLEQGFFDDPDRIPQPEKMNLVPTTKESFLKLQKDNARTAKHNLKLEKKAEQSRRDQETQSEKLRVSQQYMRDLMAEVQAVLYSETSDFPSKQKMDYIKSVNTALGKYQKAT